MQPLLLRPFPACPLFPSAPWKSPSTANLFHSRVKLLFAMVEEAVTKKGRRKGGAPARRSCRNEQNLRQVLRIATISYSFGCRLLLLFLLLLLVLLLLSRSSLPVLVFSPFLRRGLPLPARCPLSLQILRVFVYIMQTLPPLWPRGPRRGFNCRSLDGLPIGIYTPLIPPLLSPSY